MYKIYAFFCYILLCFSYYFMGDNMFQIGDLVTRKSYDNDIVFKIINNTFSYINIHKYLPF